MLSPIITVFLHFPLQFYFTIFVMAIISILMCQYNKKKCEKGLITKKRSIVLWILVNYNMLLLFFTVFGRRSWDYYRYNLDIGYSYVEALVVGNWALAVQIVANIGIFVPVGFLYGCIMDRHVLWKSILSGLAMSLTIEVLQLLLKRGCCEFDDLISNLVGTLLGSLIIVIYRLMRNGL